MNLAISSMPMKLSVVKVSCLMIFHSSRITTDISVVGHPIASYVRLTRLFIVDFLHSRDHFSDSWYRHYSLKEIGS
jgi:hypothetical protein